MRSIPMLWMLLALAASPALSRPNPIPAAVSADPPADAAHPARMEVLHIPSGGVHINGVAYLAAGAGPHPTVVLLHGLPGNEKNLDLAQAIRRAGWNAVTFNYRGSWGSPGAYSFEGNLADAKAVLAYLRAPPASAKLQIDTHKLVLAGHSMGGWVTALTAAEDPGLAGAVMISAADVADLFTPDQRASAAAFMADNMESLAGTSAQAMADEVIAFNPRLSFTPKVARGLIGTRLLILTSDDGLAPFSDHLAAAIRAGGGTRITTLHEATDHSWSGKRIALEADVIDWLDALQPSP